MIKSLEKKVFQIIGRKVRKIEYIVHFPSINTRVLTRSRELRKNFVCEKKINILSHTLDTAMLILLNPNWHHEKKENVEIKLFRHLSTTADIFQTLFTDIVFSMKCKVFGK